VNVNVFLKRVHELVPLDVFHELFCHVSSERLMAVAICYLFSIYTANTHSKEIKAEIFSLVRIN